MRSNPLHVRIKGDGTPAQFQALVGILESPSRAVGDRRPVGGYVTELLGEKPGRAPRREHARLAGGDAHGLLRVQGRGAVLSV